MEVLSIIEVWKYLRWLPNVILKRVFNKKRMSDLLLVDVAPRNDPATVNLGEIAYFELRLQVINMSPFEIEIDRLELDFLCAGVALTCQHIKKQSFKSGQISSLYLKSDISEGKATNIARHVQSKGCNHSISIHIEACSTINKFTKKSNNLEGVMVRFINENHRVN